MTRLRLQICVSSLFVASVLAALIAAPRVAIGLPSDSCNARSDLVYVNPQNYYKIGDIVRVEILLGTGAIRGGTHLTVNRVRFELDCTDFGVPCPDAGNLISYVGNISTTCEGTTWTPNSTGGPAPNEVVFSASPGVVIPAQQDPYCNLQFDIRVDNFPPTGLVIRQAGGFTIPALDAVCNTAGLLAAGTQSTEDIRICNCDDGNACTVEYCDPGWDVFTRRSSATTTTPARPTRATRLQAACTLRTLRATTTTRARPTPATRRRAACSRRTRRATTTTRVRRTPAIRRSGVSTPQARRAMTAMCVQPTHASRRSGASTRRACRAMTATPAPPTRVIRQRGASTLLSAASMAVSTTTWPCRPDRTRQIPCWINPISRSRSPAPASSALAI